MKKKFRKLMTVLLTSALVAQQGSMLVLAEETAPETIAETAAEAASSETVTESQTQTPTEPQTEPPTEAPTEPQTQAPTEPPTEAPTEPLTQAPTEPPTEAPTEPQTQAPTEPQTQAPTEPQTQAPTEPQTQAPTEPQTQAPTEPQTQAPTEPQTQAPTELQTQAPTEPQTQAPTEKHTEKPAEKTEKKNNKKETEELTEGSPIHVNDGDKVSSSDLKDTLEDVLPYLIVANEISDGTSETEEQTEGETEPLLAEEVLSGEEAESELAALEESALELANAKSSSDVEVINLYADEDGVIDAGPLEDLFEDEKIDVTEKYAVVNLVAASADQELSLSGYDLVYEDEPVTYEDVTRVGYVLYNLTSYEAGEFVDYEGTVTLENSGGLQGTWLAPAGTVKVCSDLSGAVYADCVELEEDLALEKIVLIDGREEESEEETETEMKTETESETEEPAETEALTEAPTEAEPETEALTEAPTETEPVTEAPAETAVFEELTEVNAAAVEEISESGTESTTEAPTEPESPAPETGGPVIQPAEGAVINACLVNGVTGERVLGGALAVKAAADIVNADGTIAYAKDAKVIELNDTGFSVSVNMLREGSYYLEAATVPAGYAAGRRIYFSMDTQGTAVFDTAETAWDSVQKILKYPVYPETPEGTEAPGGTVTILLTDGTGAALSGAVFVLKDASGTVIKDTAAKNPKYLVTVNGGRAVIGGLSAGDYYLSQIHAPENHIGSADMLINVPQVTTETGTTAGAAELSVTNIAVPASSNTISVTMETLFGTTVLTAEADSTSYVTLFKVKDDETGELTEKAADVKTVTQKTGQTVSDAVVFGGLEAGVTYYLAETDEYGTPITGAEHVIPHEAKFVFAAQGDDNFVKIKEAAEAEAHDVKLQRICSAYLEGLFSHQASLKITKNVHKNNGNAKAIADAEFYVSVFADQELKTKLGDTFRVALNGTDAADITITSSEIPELKMTTQSRDFYIAETDASGTPLAKGADGNYSIGDYKFSKIAYTADGKVTVNCGSEAAATVTNTLIKRTVKMKVTDASGKLLPGAELLIKNSKRKALKINGNVKFDSESSEIVWEGILPEGSYYLSEIKAPSGYLPAPDVPFTVEDGKIAEAVLTNTAASGGVSAAVGLQIYEGSHQLYAQDTSSGAYAAKGLYTRYVALFSDKECTQKVTDVQSLKISGFTGTTTFKHLESGKTYYMAETDQYGQVRSSNDTREIRYTNSGALTAGSSTSQAVISEVYKELPQGFCYTARLTIEKQVTDSSGAAKAVTGTFYVGIFRNADYSGTPTLIKLELNNASSASATRRILLSGTKDVTYYIAEVDQSGQRITDSSSFGYTASIDKNQVTLTRSSDEKVVVTNKEKVSKVTLYLTKRVYEGSNLKKVNGTFYAGLFKDPQFTEMYTKPVQLNLKDSSSVTLKLSLNLGTASEATIYVAEVDQNGKVVKSGEAFGYDTRLINSTAAFTQETTEIQSIIINTVHGTTTDSDWNDILSSDDNNVGNWDTSSGDDWYSDYVSDNGTASGSSAGGSFGYGNSVLTADTTPWALYLTLLLISGAAVAAGGFRRRRTKKQG